MTLLINQIHVYLIVKDFNLSQKGRPVASLIVDTEENGENDFPGNLSTCVSHCKRLQFIPVNQASCIAKREDKHTDEGYTPYRFRLNTSELLNPFVLCSD